MWLMTQHGFYSIVRNRFDESGRTWFVRSRQRRDLENLVTLADLERAELDLCRYESPSADYRFRLVVEEPELGAIRDAFFAALDYSNFKARVAETADQQDKVDPYGVVWATLARLRHD